MVTIQLGTIITETEGGNLLEILRRTPALAQAVGKIASPCGGWGTCGKCRIAVDGSRGRKTAVPCQRKSAGGICVASGLPV